MLPSAKRELAEEIGSSFLIWLLHIPSIYSGHAAIMQLLLSNSAHLQQ